MSSSKRSRRACISQPSLAAKEVLKSKDLMLEILKHLPKKEVLNCRRVCKNWRSLISSLEYFRTKNHSTMKPDGCLLFDPLSAKRSRFVYFDDQVPQRKSSSPYLDFPLRKIKIVQSCNGLILCCKKSMPTKECFACNVTTKQVVKLNIPGEGGYRGKLGMAFDPRLSPYYKVLFLKFPECKVYVYSSESREWSCSETRNLLNPSHENPFTKMDLSTKVYYNGAMYWMDLHLGYCLCFNIETSTLKRLRMPGGTNQDGTTLDGNSMFCCMSVAADSLYLVEKIGKQDFDVYEMKEEGSDWVDKCHLKEPIGHIGGDDVEALFVFQDVDGELCIVLSGLGAIASYSLDKKLISRMLVFRYPGLPSYTTYEYLETLISI